MSELISLAGLTEEDRKYVFDKYKIIEPYINNQGTLKEIAQRNTIPRRTLSSWVNKYKEYGLVGLFRQVRRDKGAARHSVTVALLDQNPDKLCFKASGFPSHRFMSMIYLSRRHRYIK